MDVGSKEETKINQNGAYGGSDQEVHQNSSPESLYFDNPKLKGLSTNDPTVAATLKEHGPMIDNELRHSDAPPAHPELWWSRVRSQWQEAFSEFFGVFVLILFGDGVVAQVVLSDGEKGNYQSINWGWG